MAFVLNVRKTNYVADPAKTCHDLNTAVDTRFEKPGVVLMEILYLMCWCENRTE